MGRDRRLDDEELSPRERELEIRVLGLLSINRKAEDLIGALYKSIRSLKQQKRMLKKQLESQMTHFKAALESTAKLEKKLEDLKAENRALRVTVRSFSISQRDPD